MVSYNGFEQNPDDTYAMWTPAGLRQTSVAKGLKKEMKGFEYIAVRLDGEKPVLAYFTALQKVEPGTTLSSPFGNDGDKLLTLTGKQFLLIYHPNHDASAVENDLNRTSKVRPILDAFGIEDKGEKRTAIVKFVSDLQILLREIAARPKPEEPVTIIPAAKEVTQQPPAAVPSAPPSQPVEPPRAAPPAPSAVRRREPILGRNEPSLPGREPFAAPSPSRQATPPARRASASASASASAEDRMPAQVFDDADKFYEELFKHMGRPMPWLGDSNDGGPRQ